MSTAGKQVKSPFSVDKTTSVIPGSITFTTTGSTADPTIVSPSFALVPPRECVTRPGFGDDKHCPECQHALECMAGMLPEVLSIAATKQEQIEGDTLPCVEDGKVRLMLLERVSVVNSSLTETSATFDKIDYRWVTQ